MDNTPYNEEQVFYCTQCLSLKIRFIEEVEHSEYCDECGNTNISKTSIEEWETLYQNKYGHKLIE